MPPITPQPRSPSTTTSDENNTVTWEHLEHAPLALSTRSADATAHNHDNRSTADNRSEEDIGHGMHARSEAVHLEDVMAIPQGTGTGTGMGPGTGRAPAIRIYPPGDAGSASVSGASGVGGSTKSASFSGR
ncbi:uncharacterized protein AKAW2_70162A [Aspergillus luchuensis]|uniref:Uncharacterized protein n=1 Tax=Aspergillus kawachii TaxID=1069201 RepID=A0A146FGN6_ASPKA|nr:uncharacterized protein AKAW2_70162A [Aspergillus luchuensis]BCS03284.1 hypothetical protein AKAW2_70162A [Aspergillus luchuensis]BCS14914.1 hypothetical protein ALUC_70147A [Aspergillus luchuensis]GAA84818.1 hypothetical protein AKAW_02932 [Aspergillus luchuensis IFO 4308]GAT24583.1 hypothetical protein RIB2604_01804130 [Aspergillus luchuensis]